MHRFAIALSLLAAAGPLTPVHAETTRCTEIQALPAVVSTSGVYCLRRDLSTGMGSGQAITINANNATLDCNGHKLGGLAAGVGTQAVGVYAYNRANVTIRNCNIRGFQWGVGLFGGAGGGHLVEDNRFDGNTYVAVHVEGDGSTIRDNLVFSTGGSSYGGGWSLGIDSRGDSSVVDNTIWGMTPVTARNDVQAIFIGDNVGGMVSGNRISGLAGEYNSGIRVYSSASRVRLVGNSVDASAWTLYCDQPGGGLSRDNLVSGGSVDANCADAGGNFRLP